MTYWSVLIRAIKDVSEHHHNSDEDFSDSSKSTVSKHFPFQLIRCSGKNKHRDPELFRLTPEFRSKINTINNLFPMIYRVFRTIIEHGSIDVAYKDATITNMWLQITKTSHKGFHVLQQVVIRAYHRSVAGYAWGLSGRGYRPTYPDKAFEED